VLAPVEPAQEHHPVAVRKAEVFYSRLRQKEFESGVIARKNWSGKNIWRATHKQGKNHVNKILTELNNIDLEIWL
jgi:hypothetical protein